MPRRKWIDKKSAAHFTLVHRPQNDPLIHDESAPSMVLNPTYAPNASKIKRLGDLASELGSDAESIRENEGEAANHRVYYDDTAYDYMQHLRDLGSGGGDSVFLEPTAIQGKYNGKQKQSLADALAEMDLQDRSTELFGDEILPSKNLQKASYQTQQNVPDAIAGFQPDMDPRLREALEALEDDAFVDDDDDLFKELAKDGQELDDYEFEDTYPEDDEYGWESDDTAKPHREYNEDQVPQLVKAANTIEASNTISSEGDDATEETAMGEEVNIPDGSASPEWMREYGKFAKDSQSKTKKPSGPSPSDLQSSIMSTTTDGGRRKKRKGALTSPSGYSMTSSSMVRTEQLTILDARFDKIEEEYIADMDDMESVSALSTASSVQGALRPDFDNIMDEFLGSYSMQGKKKVKKGKYQSGLEQLDEIRRDLGPARLPARQT